MNKVYTRINWENEPSTETPLNETNLNKVDYALDAVDDRVISLDTTKLDLSTGYTMVKDVSYDEDTGTFTVAYLNGATYKFDTKLEKIAVNFHYDVALERLAITLDDGTVQYVDLSALITQYEFLNSDTISFTIASNGRVSAEVVDGSITADKLEPDYLAQIKVETAASAANAANAATSEANAAQSEANAATSEANAAQSEANAATSEANAAQSAADAETQATLSQSYAVGGTGTRSGEDTDNAKYYSGLAAQSEANAATSEANAAQSEANAATSEANAAQSEANAATSAEWAEYNADRAENYYKKTKDIADVFDATAYAERLAQLETMILGIASGYSEENSTVLVVAVTQTIYNGVQRNTVTI